MSDAEILFNVQDQAGIITLNRPQALNALTYNMVALMSQKLDEWAKDPAIKCVIVTGAGDRAFCAGGDIKSVALAVKSGDTSLTSDFFRCEYTLNNTIHNYPKPYIALINGIVMGGGKGVSAHGSHRIVTENVLFAMPETTIGFFPDVGGGYFLPRCPGETGAYLALTSKRIKTVDCMYIGFATHFVPAAQINTVRDDIAKSPQDIDAILKKFSGPLGQPELLQYRTQIDHCFGHDRVEDILSDLEKDGSPWAQETLAALNAVSPTSLKIALKQIRLGATMNFADVMTMEYRLSQFCLHRPDFYEGVRAALIDKDRQPKWAPATAHDVKDSDVDVAFRSLGAQDLVF